jgi:hypothetical protein
MDKPQPAAERVRHILRMMDRSIDTARQHRLRESNPQDPPDDQPATEVNDRRNGADTPPVRQKARPKRPAHLNELDRGTSFRQRSD